MQGRNACGRTLCYTAHSPYPPSAMRKFSIAALRGHLMFWSVSAALMIIDDAAMLALIFC